MALNLFALTNNPDNRIARFALSSPVQQELTQYLTRQEQEFRSSIQTTIQFDGKYKPDAGEVLVISGFDDIDGLGKIIRNPLGVEEIQPSATTFETIKALFTGYLNESDETIILIQHFDKRKIISTNGLSIFHAANVYKKIEGIGVTVDSKLSAIIEGGDLKFFSFHLMRQIFNLSEYYKEATDSDIHDFASMSNIKVGDTSQLISLADGWIRRKVSLILQSQILEKIPICDIKAVAFDFNIPFVTINENGDEYIKIPLNKAELKTLLRFLDEDYYKSPLSKAQYLTNSKRLVVC